MSYKQMNAESYTNLRNPHELQADERRELYQLKQLNCLSLRAIARKLGWNWVGLYYSSSNSLGSGTEAGG